MNILEVSGLRKEYPSFLLNDVGFEVPQGTIMGLVGRNGAGKSTTLKSLLGLVHPDGGEVRFLRHDVREDEKFFKENIGVVLGGVDFYNRKKIGTITEVTSRFYSGWNEKKYRHYSDLFKLKQEKRVSELSTGMRMKYMIALALSHGAQLLILDEPTSGLDPVSRDELVSLFRAIVNDGKHSILFSTHITSDLEKCASHISYIKDGGMLHSGTIESFRARFADQGSTLEEIIIAMERRDYGEGSII